MQKDFILPDIGEGIVECEVIEWKIKEGDRIEEDQIVVDVSTDKAIVEIPSMYNGRITRLHYAEGDTAKVHEPLFAIELDGEEAAVTESLPEKAAAPAEQAVAVPSSAIASDAVTSDNTVNQKGIKYPRSSQNGPRTSIRFGNHSGDRKTGPRIKRRHTWFFGRG